MGFEILVPKVCLGTPVAKLRFAERPLTEPTSRGRSAEPELRDLRPQAELGDESNESNPVPRLARGYMIGLETQAVYGSASS